MEAPPIAVIMPNYNKGEYIGPAIRSVLGQTFPYFELIVVDDCSTDYSLEVVQQYLEDPRVNLIRHSKNLGTPAALNTGIRSSKAPLLTFLGSDDLFAPDRLEIEIQTLAQHNGPVIAYSDAINIGEKVTSVSGSQRMDGSKPNGLILDKLLSGILRFNYALITVPRVCLERVGLFDESLRWAEDLEMSLRLARFYPFVYVPMASYGYRIYPENSINIISRRTGLKYRTLSVEKHLMLNKSNLNKDYRRLAYRSLLKNAAQSREWSKLFRHGLTNFDGLSSLVWLLLRKIETS